MAQKSKCHSASVTKIGEEKYKCDVCGHEVKVMADEEKTEEEIRREGLSQEERDAEDKVKADAEAEEIRRAGLTQEERDAEDKAKEEEGV